MSRNAVSIAEAERVEADVCRRLMLGVEPWATLGYGEAQIDAIARASVGDRVLLAHLGSETGETSEVVGFALSTPGFLLGEYLKVLVVDRRRRGSGIGRALMAELEKRAFRSWPNVYLCVSDFNRDARRFYAALGYEEVGVLPELVVPARGEVLMRKTIGAWRRFQRSDAGT